MMNTVITLFGDNIGSDDGISYWEIMDVKDHYFLHSVTQNINILYIPIFQLKI